PRVLMGVSPLAPGWYVLALSVMGLVLGVWLPLPAPVRPRAGATTEGSVFFTNR
ncbi:MFS transporter, partial [Enterobacter hormaechei subsp. steigerwaltii]